MRRLLSLLVLLACAGTVQAQLRVSLSIKRRLHMMYEPILATVSVTNLSGRDVPLEDADGQRWFSFQVLREDGEPVPPLDANYQLEPMIIPAGQTAKRTVTLNTLYPVHDIGLYHIRAAIYFCALKRYFQSTQATVEIEDGKVIWQQTVGVPDGQKGAGETRRISVLTFRQEDADYVYTRVEDDDHGLVYCTYPLGKLIDGIAPQIQLDSLNQLNVLQVVGPKTYLFTRVGVNGQWMGQKLYMSARNSRPVLHKDEVGEIDVAGGIAQQPQGNGAGTLAGGAASATEESIPKLSDRPADLPKN